MAPSLKSGPEAGQQAISLFLTPIIRQHNSIADSTGDSTTEALKPLPSLGSKRATSSESDDEFQTPATKKARTKSASRRKPAAKRSPTKKTIQEKVSDNDLKPAAIGEPPVWAEVSFPTLLGLSC